MKTNKNFKKLVVKLKNLKQSSTYRHAQLGYLDIWVEPSKVSTQVPMQDYMHCIAIMHNYVASEILSDIYFCIFFFYVSVLNPLK